MRYFPPLLCFVSLVVSTESVSLRKVGDDLEIQADVSELPRRLQEQAGSDFENGSGVTRQDNSDEGILNELIAFFLPAINTVFQELVPDPLTLDFEREYQLQEIDIFACKVRADFSFSLGEIIGLKGMSIDRLKVVPGTEKVNPGCLETLWNAAFDMQISSQEMFTVEDLVGGLAGKACGYSFDDEVTGGVNTYQPTMRGAVDISGNILGKIASITLADIGKALTVEYTTIEGYLDNVPAAWNVVIGDATKQVSEAMKGELSHTIEPEVNPKAKVSMEGRRVILSNRQAFSINSGFVRNGVSRSVRRAYQDTANFFGNAVSALGFGGNDEGGE